MGTWSPLPQARKLVPLVGCPHPRFGLAFKERPFHPFGMPKPMHIQFPGLDPIPILFEDRTVLAIDKPAGWMLIPFTWQRTNRNLQAAIDSSIAGGHFWAKSRNLKYLRHIHRLDAETTGILLFAKSAGALDVMGDLFEQREMEKVYLAVVAGEPRQSAWICQKSIGPVPKQFGRMRIDPKEGKPAETSFKMLASANGRTLIECRPVTGRTHQIRVHLLDAGLSIIGDPMYGSAGKATYLSPDSIARPRELHRSDANQRVGSLSHREARERRNLEEAADLTGARSIPGSLVRATEEGERMVRPVSARESVGVGQFPMGLRAVKLGFTNPFTKKRVFIKAPREEFLAAFGFERPTG